MLKCNKGIHFPLVDMLNLHMPSLTFVSMIFFLLVVQCFNLGFGTHVTSCICCAVQCFQLFSCSLPQYESGNHVTSMLKNVELSVGN